MKTNPTPPVFSTTDTETKMGELILYFKFSPVPAIYCGAVTACLGHLYKQITGDNLYVILAETGSLKVKMAGLKKYVRPFANALGRIINKHLSPDQFEQTIDKNVEAMVNIYVDKHELAQAQKSNLEAETAKSSTQTKLSILKEYPEFLKSMTQLYKEINPDASPEVLMNTVKASSDFFTAYLDLGNHKMLDESTGLNMSIQDLKDSITIQLPEVEDNP